MNAMNAPGEQRVICWNEGKLCEQPDELAVEAPLEIRVRGRALSVTMRTPGDDVDLAAGFLLTEGLIKHSDEVWRTAHCTRHEEDNVLNVTLAPEVHVDFERLTRHVFASSSCGLCGKATIDAVCAQFPPVCDGPMVDLEMLSSLPEIMRRTQATFNRTGGLHAAALFDEHGELAVLREDVGRHNAVDKVLGHALLQDWLPLDRHVLLVSGRSSFEIMQKALAGRVAVIAAVSAPSSLAVQFAHDSGQTLIGFLRGRRMNIYSHAYRVRGLEAEHAQKR